MASNDYISKLCSSTKTITSELAQRPTHEIGSIVKELRESLLHEAKGGAAEKEEDVLEHALRCGKFGTRPSDLFLQVYSSVLRTLHNPLAGVVSPSLLGSSGTIPLTIVSVVPDIMRHFADLIINAKHEVFLATNYWETSHSSGIITDALRELSKRQTATAKGSGKQIVVKLMYDRGTPSQILHNHATVPPAAYTDAKVSLPAPEDIPGIALEVVNYHRPLLGTFHAKYMVVDRRVACLNSNNIQDRPNLEMMVQMEGPIVESFYDMALLSWSNAMDPPLPLVGVPPDGEEAKFGDENGSVGYIDTAFTSKASRKLLQQQHERGGDRSITQHPAMHVPTESEGEVSKDNPGSPSQEAAKTPEVTEAKGRLGHISALLNEATAIDMVGTAVDDVSLDDFLPHIIHAPHGPVPIAMVNRHPRGALGNDDVETVPQNTAWLSAMKHAQKSVFIQSPTLNAAPMIPAILDACRRDVVVTIYLSLGYNDLGEMIPGQGGTNEQVVHAMYTTLGQEGRAKQENLKVYWYTGKDQIEPVGATTKQRNCHVKFMSVDGQIAILGNGNQDTQSWFHSQEINVLVDSAQIVREWVVGIEANQSTRRYGLVSSEDGVWRSKDGRVVESSGTKTSGLIGSLKGLGGAVARVRGTGGF